ncbi:PEP-CTERM -sorting domain protein [Nostoc cycadae WK-1]|uniref:PEP-CTERM-sorting domain protein n=1 Tax=Nostoc cycadae WK-1 TaxID=1861711 RepID=A0A2H6LCS0_9NOSO|nr:PEP-CTERM -sorting domain protein [Nostoc cycadae WK-1]
MGFTHQFLLLTTSWLASSVLLTSPSQAATIALSQGRLLFTNISQSPTSTFTNTDTNATSIFQGGNVATNADAIAYLGTTPPVGYSLTSSQAFGENNSYLGIGKSKSTIQGIFNVNNNTHFSFNFTGDLNLATFTTNTKYEKASASGNLGFALINLANNNVLDYFQVGGSLTTAGNDSLTYQNSKNVKFGAFTMSNFVGQQEFTTTAFSGYLNHYFPNQTTIALVAFNSTQSRVSVPTPSMLPALIFGWGVISMGLKRKRQKSRETCLAEKK